MIPKELNELFYKMLDSVDPDDRILSDKLFLIATLAQHPVLEQPPLNNAFLYLWLEDLDDLKFPLNRPTHAYSDSDLDERIQDVTCRVDRLSRGLLEVTHQQHQQEKYFAFEVRFTHRTAYDYIFNTWLPRMQKRTPKFNTNLATVRLLLAQFKHARARPTDVEPLQPVHLWKPTGLLHHFQSTFDWISAINKVGYEIPSQYLEEFGKILESDPPKEYRTTTVWLIFLWYFVDTLLGHRDASKPSLVLEEFLNCGNVDCDVQFVVCSSSLSTPQSKKLEIEKENSTQDDSNRTYSISLLKAVELRNLPNVETLRTKIRERNPWWSRGQLGTKLAPWVRIQSGRDCLDPRCRELTAKDIRSNSDLYLDSIITKTDRLDAPFSFTLS